MELDISIGGFELRPGYLRIGRFFEIAVTSWPNWKPRRLEFHRPDETHEAYYLFWRTLEIVWEFPWITARRARRVL